MPPENKTCDDVLDLESRDRNINGGCIYLHHLLLDRWPAHVACILNHHDGNAIGLPIRHIILPMIYHSGRFMNLVSDHTICQYAKMRGRGTPSP